MLRSFLAMAATGALLSAAQPASAAFTVNFGTLAGDASPVTVPTSDGNSVTFDSPSGPGTFTVANTGFYQSFGEGLGDYASFSGDTLTLTFANPIAGGVSFPFGLEDFGALFGNDYLTVSSNTGVTIVANAALDTAPLPVPEGMAYINAPGATQLTITSGIPANSNPFAIGNVSVPEPFTLSVLGVGLAGLTAVRRRRG